MANTVESRAHVILEAVRHASNGDVPALRQLTANRPDALKLEVTLRIILTYLPVGKEPGQYRDFLRDLPAICASSPRCIQANSLTATKHDLSEDEARARVRRLRLASLADDSTEFDGEADPLTHFLLRQAYRIDAETGSLELVSQLLEPFVDHSEVLRTWIISSLLPLLRLEYEYYPHAGSAHTLREFEKLDGEFAVQLLLSKAAQRKDPGDTQKIGRDLRGLVGPWMYGETSRKRRKLSQRTQRKSSLTANRSTGGQDIVGYGNQGSEWSHVNNWLVDLSIRDFQKTVDAAVQWDGPNDVDYGDWGNGNQSLDEPDQRLATCRYAQADLASLYATNASSLETIIGSHRTLLQIARLMGHDEPSDLKRTDTPIISGLSQDYLKSLSSAHLLRNALLLPQNPFTLPETESINLFNLVLASCYKLLNLGNVKSSRTVAELALFGGEPDQSAELRKTLHRLKAEKMDGEVWKSIRRQMLWLRNWEQQPESSEQPRGIFSKIAKKDLEVEVLRSMLDGGCYSLAVDIYCKPTSTPLLNEVVESTIMGAALSAYDAASNGNRTRGGVRKASDMMATFRDYFSDSLSFKQTSSLLSATHAMSFYSLTLQHGVPFQPVNIRAHKDPISLVGKILSQNPQSYTHLDDMLDIGRNLLAAGLTQHDQETSRIHSYDVNMEQESITASRRITRMAIEAALEEDDFETAYSYVVNRLSRADQPQSNLSGQLYTMQDDISWRAAYQAGRFSVSSPGTPKLRRMEQRMELLSQALLLAPPSALSEVLTTWQKCEHDLTTQIASEAAEDEKWDEKADWRVPGGFAAESRPVKQKARNPTRGTLVEEAPMGLFDVARGAAAALSKSTFPLRNKQRAGPGSPSTTSHGRPLRGTSVGSSDEGSNGEIGQPERVRKRDMVSSMVTGGLASGIGWVIGESQKHPASFITEIQNRCSASQARMNEVHHGLLPIDVLQQTD